MGVIRPDSADAPELSDDQLLDSVVVAKLSSAVLRSKRFEFRRKQEDLRLDLMIRLAGAANASMRPLPKIAEMMGMSERELKELITLSARGNDPTAILTFFTLSRVGNRQACEELATQLEAFEKAEQIYVALRKESMRRDREAREREERELKQRREQEIARLLMQKKAEQESTVLVKTAIPDAPGHDCKPDPLNAGSPEEFVDTMRRYRIWAGNPSLREMARRCGQRFSHATFRNALNAPTLPGFDMVETLVTVLGGTAEDKSRWVTAWRSFTVPQQATGNRNVTPLRLTGS